MMPVTNLAAGPSGQPFRLIRAALVAAPVVLSVLSVSFGTDARAQDRPSGNLLDNLFSRGDQQQAQSGEAAAESDLVVRIGRLENQLRQMTGTLEQLQFRNQQLEQQLKRMQDDYEYRFQQLSGGKPTAPQPTAPQPAARQPAGPSPVQPVQPGRRSDVFDPNQQPGAPGAPRALGDLASNGPPQLSGGPATEGVVGAPGGREAGAPLDLSSLSANPSAAAPPPAANPGPPQLATLPPSQNPKDEYDLAYGYVLHKDYALAEQAFRDFLRRHKGDRAEPDAQYWLGEVYYQKQRYQEAAETFLIVVRNFDTAPKAPDALLRLGQSLAALHQKEAACATLAEVARKYPRASASVKRGVENEQKRARC